MLRDIVPVILAGGAGKRLWPLSRLSYPKPFLKFFSNHSFLQKTLTRTKDMQKAVIVTHKNHRPVLIEQLRDIEYTPRDVLLEPHGKNTAPAIAAACHLLEKENPYILVMPSDHNIGDINVMLEAIQNVMGAAEHDSDIVLFGIVPKSAETRYGYIKKGALRANNVFSVEAFKEKPSAQKARDYLIDGSYLWNSGIFLCRVNVFLQTLKAIDENLYTQSYNSVAKAARYKESVFLEEKSYELLPHIAVDYAVMEQAKNLAVVPVDMKWRDMGTWSSLLKSTLGI